ncbi:MAG: hypothetical protein Ta2B_01530 [Termitinemataceae bacterium]|nr:MAG: hypothetical protein Ta2B_01530 [Termitinemataceae bacterium]
MTAVILQARLDSSRLPCKALLDICGQSLIVRVMQALNNVQSEIRILACPEDSFDDFLPLTKKNKFEIFAGSKNDVLNRYCSAIKHFGLNTKRAARVIRATGDNPFVFADAAQKINDEAARLNADYAGYSGLPYGAGVESVSVSALLKANEMAVSAFDREHVCPYLYNNPKTFNLHRPLAPKKWQGTNVRVTVDEESDYQNAKRLYAYLSKKSNVTNRYNGDEVISCWIDMFS